jgi:glycosyltransferase involved in cell wall biosynthesis
MHIGLVSFEYPTSQAPAGGLAAYTQKIARGLAGRGHDVSVIYTNTHTSIWRERERVSVYAIQTFRFNRHLFQFRKPRFIFQVIEKLIVAGQIRRAVMAIHKKKPFDIVQSPEINAPALALIANTKFPVVCRCSGYLPIRMASSHKKRELSGFFSHWQEIQMINGADRAFAPSQYIVNIYEQFEMLNLDLLRTPFDDVAGQFDHQFYEQHLHGKEYLLYPNTLSRLKGIDIFAQALPKLLARFPNLHVVFLGQDTGYQSYERAIDYIKERVGAFHDRIFYHQPILKTSLYPVMQKALGVVVPSRIDNYPNSCLEAIMLGVPVIGTYQSSIEEIIEDGKTGYLAQNADSESLYQALCKLLALDSKGRQRMADNLAEAKRNILSEDRLGQLIEYYQNTISSWQLSKKQA